MLHSVLAVFVGAVWVFHGLYSKILNRIPRHRQIVARVLGGRLAVAATYVVGAGEVVLGIWAWTGWQPVWCASVQTSALVAMNVLEIFHARDLLISAAGMVFLNILFLSLVWVWALG